MISIVTASTPSHQWMVDKLRITTEKYNYVLKNYKLNDRSLFGIDFSKVSIRTLLGYKPNIMLHALDRTTASTLVWIDADAFITNPMPELEYLEYDVGITAHKTKREVNSGVVILNNNTRARQFLHYWMDRTPHSGKLHIEGDQAYLRGEIERYYPDSRKLIDRNVDHDGVRLRFVPSELYNETMPGDPITAKIVHVAFSKPTKEERYAKYERMGCFG